MRFQSLMLGPHSLRHQLPRAQGLGPQGLRPQSLRPQVMDQMCGTIALSNSRALMTLSNRMTLSGTGQITPVCVCVLESPGAAEARLKDDNQPFHRIKPDTPDTAITLLMLKTSKPQP